MKEITILSGKGGTGKTTIAAAIASVADHAVFCDNDVDAADLHLIVHPEVREENTFFSGWIAQIDEDLCTKCRLCMDKCRFKAIYPYKNGVLQINPFQCEGCRLCERICPEKAISSVRKDNNYWYVSSSRFGTLIHAKMGPGEENSGKLVTQVRKRAKEIAKDTKMEYIINDGPPGIGCATIASLTGVDLVLIVIEPTKSGLHDLKRLISLVNSFNIPVYTLINKYDINQIITTEIEDYLNENKIKLLAKIPFDKTMVEAMIAGKTIVEYKPESRISLKIGNLWKEMKNNNT